MELGEGKSVLDVAELMIEGLLLIHVSASIPLY